jgi:2,4-dienoyl-CoA reductase-like NADH-dependent reductase (Old Yellow Enzyme family)
MSENVKTHTATPGSANGWKDVWAPSSIPFAEGYPTPVEMTLEDIEELKKAWGEAVDRAEAAGESIPVGYGT